MFSLSSMNLSKTSQISGPTTLPSNPSSSTLSPSFLHQQSSTSRLRQSQQPEIYDTGLKAWTMVLGAWLSQFCGFGYANAFGVYNDYYVREHMDGKYSSAQIGWIGGVQLFLALSSGLFTGRAHDSGYFPHLMIGGTLLNVFSLFMLSLVQEGEYYQVFLAQAVGQGLGIGLTYVPSLALISQYFDKRRSLAFGIASTGAAIGGVVHPILLNNFFYGSLGFQNGVRASAGLVAGLSSVSLLLMKNKIPYKSRAPENTFFKDTKTYLREPPYLFMMLGTFMVLLGMFEPSFFIQLSTVKNNIDETLAFYTIAMMNGSSVLGRILPTLLIKDMGAFNLQIVFTVSCSAIIFSSIAVYNVPGTIIFSVLFGLFQGAYVGILTPMISSLAKDSTEIGSRLGVCFSLSASAALFGLPISGALLGPDYAWWRPSFFAGLSFFIGAVLFCLSRYLLVKQKGSNKV